MNNMNNINNMNLAPGLNPYPNMYNMNLDPNVVSLLANQNLNNINQNQEISPISDINNNIHQSLPLNFPQFSGESGAINSQGELIDIYGIINSDNILCSLSEKTELSKYENIKIEIALGEKKPGSFFSKAYQTYVISLPKLNLKVNRRYSDFEWLRQILVTRYPSCVIPPIPKKNKLGGDRFNEEFLLKRTRTLEKFLNLLVEDPNIKSSQIFYDFVSVEEAKFNEIKKQHNSMKLPQCLKEYKSLDGKLDIKVDDSREIYYQNMKDHMEINQELLTKLNKQIKLLYNELNIVISRLDEITKNCEELFSNSVKYSENDDLKISYYELADMFKHWSTTLKKQNALTYIDIREHFKFSKNTLKSMKDLIYSVDTCKQNYYKSKKNLISKKEDLFKKGDKTRWDLNPNNPNVNINTPNLEKDKNIALPNMLYNETNAVSDLKQIYGYYLNSVNNEFSRLEKILAFGHKHNLIDNAKKEITIISELFKNISDIAVSSPKYSIDNIVKEIKTENNNKEEEKK
jgi:sorting nexin-7/30/sorting nexin-8